MIDPMKPYFLTCNFPSAGQRGQRPAYMDRQTIIYIGKFVCLSSVLDNLDNLYLSKNCPPKRQFCSSKCDDIWKNKGDGSVKQNKVWTDTDTDSPYRETPLLSVLSVVQILFGWGLASGQSTESKDSLE